MSRRIAILQGHPDPAGGHFVHALADAYERAARAAGHEVRRIDVARLEFPLLHNAQQAIAWAEHLAIFYPLWLGDMPALLKGFFEQVLRPGFAVGKAAPGKLWKKKLAGRSARIVVTMGMPAFFYRVYYRAHSLKSLKRNILEFCGVAPVRATVIGMVEGRKEARAGWLTRLSALGAQGR
ncbi:MAG TPA: NAD(P)H-dependent oxidoreductase [Burkholderiales bacterium]